MITICPYCGHDIIHSVKHGLTSCINCKQIFEASEINKLLGASWIIRKNHNLNYDLLAFQTKLDREQLDFVFKYIAEEGYCHDDFLEVLKTSKWNINKKPRQRTRN